MSRENKQQRLNELRDPLLSKITMMKGEKGDQGDPGYSPIRGKDYYTQTEINFIIEHITNTVQAKVKDGGQGIQGETGVDGRAGATPIRGVDYWTPKDQEKILQSVIAKMPIPKNGISPKMDDVVNKVVDELKNRPIEFKDIKGTEKLVEFLKRGGFRGGGGSGGSGTTVTLQTNGVLNGSQTLLNLVQGTNMTITDDGMGNITFDATGGGSSQTLAQTLALGNTTGGTNLVVSASDLLSFQTAGSKNISINQARISFNDLSDGNAIGLVGHSTSGSNQTITLPDATGTVALTSQLLTLQTNGTPNGSQTLLNLIEGTNITLTDDGVGGITIDATGGGGSPGGSDTQLQYNNSGSFGGMTGYFDNSNNQLVLGDSLAGFDSYLSGNGFFDVRNTLTSLNSADFYGGASFVSQSDGSFGSNYGSFFVAYATDGSVSANYGGDAEAIYAGSNTLSNNKAFSFEAFNRGSGTITNNYAIYVDNPALYGSGPITNSYGILVANQTGGSSNWAIKTGLGLVEFGDNVLVHGSITSNTSLLLQETGGGSDKITIQAPASISAGYTLTLPVDDGTPTQVLTTDGSGVLSWTTPTTGTVTSVSGTSNRITSTGGATPVIDISGSYVGQGSITTVGTLSSGAIPASLITAGTFGSGAYSFGTGNAVTLGTIELGAASDTTISRVSAGVAAIEGKTIMTLPTSPADYTVTNVTTDRTYDANSTTIDELADVLGTLIADLTSLGLLQ